MRNVLVGESNSEA